MNKKRVIFLLFFFLILKIPQFIMLPDFDTGIYATDALLLNQGKMLYVDVWTQKPPGLIVLYSAVFLLAGPSLISLKIMGILYMALTCISLFYLVKFLFDRNTAYYSTLFFIAASFYLVFSLDGLDSEYFFLLPVLWGSLLFLKGINREKFWLVFLSGILLGFAFFIKQVIFWNILVLAVYGIVMAIQERRYLFYLKFLSILAAGFLIFQVLWMAYFILNGSFMDMINNAFLFNLKYIKGSFGLSGYLELVVSSFGKVLIGIFLIWVLGISKFFHILKDFKNKSHLFLVLFFSFTFIGVFTGMRFFGHYFVQVIPGICILAGLFSRDFIHGMRTERQGRRNIFKKTKLYIFSVIILSVLLYALVQGFYLNKYAGDNPYYRIKEVSTYIKSRTEREDSIYVWGFPPSIYFLSNRSCPVRFCFLPIPLPDPDPRIKILSQLNESLPKIIVKSQSASRVEFPGLEKLLEEKYKMIKEYEVKALNRKSGTDIMQVFLKDSD